ncbi:MAG: AMP-binding protein [Clostridia bacterium]|nr:AMP-binding protein [Clostridia bacterium]
MYNSMLNDIITRAYNTVEYYRELFTLEGIEPSDIKKVEDLKRIPILSKDMIQKAPQKFISNMYHLCSDDLIKQRTSGSTGRFLKIYWTPGDMLQSLFPMWVARSRAYGIKPSSKYCSFHSYINFEDKWESPEEYYFNERNLSFSKLILDQEHLFKYYRRMMEFEPDWLFLQPSIAYLLAKYISDNKLEIPQTLKYIELTGEFLFENYREFVKKTFKIPVVNEYGCTETNGIAIECPNGHLHCLSNNVVVEMLKDGEPVKYGEEGEVHVTSLSNTAMPFIRYALGDMGILYPAEICSCGNKNPVIKVLAGRLSQFVLLEGKEPVNCFVLNYAVESINFKQGYPIAQFQVIQENYKQFKVWFVLEESFKGNINSIVRQFKDEMEKMGLSGLEWEFTFVNQILPSPVTGKLQFFLNKMEN